MVKVLIDLVDRDGKKSQLELTGDAKQVEKDLDHYKRTLTKRGMQIVGHRVVLDDGSVGSMDEKHPCTGCGRVSSGRFEKIERTKEGIAIARTVVYLCHKDVIRFAKDGEYREKLWVQGLTMNLMSEEAK